MKKRELRDYFDTKFVNLKAEVREEVREIFQKSFETAYQSMSEHQVISIIGQVADDLEKVYEAHGVEGFWEFSSFIADLRGRKGKQFFEDRLRTYVSRAQDAFLNQRTPELPVKCIEVAYNALVKSDTKLKSLSKRLNDLEKLESEIDAVILGNNAPKAYKLLKELGVDMSDLEASTAPMPVPVRLSVDVCVLNGGCD